jgi:hypothetical protein
MVAMKSLEVRAVERQNTSPLTRSALQDSLVVPALLASLLNGQNVVPKSPESFDNEVVEVLIRVKKAHRCSGLRVPTNEVFDLARMLVVILPSSDEIVESQPWHRTENVLFTSS